MSSSTIPPSYHTHHSYPDLPSYPITPLRPTYGFTLDLSAPPSAYTTNRARVQGPRSRTSSWSSRRDLRDSGPPPLPSTSREDPFADSQPYDGTQQPTNARRARQAVDGGVRLAGGPLNHAGAPEGDWDYVAIEAGPMPPPDEGHSEDVQ